MITAAIMSLMTWLVKTAASLIDLPRVPDFFGELAGYAATVGGYVASTGAWFPWGLLVAVIAAYGVCLLAGLAVKLARIVASFLTAGGGSAA